MGTDPVIDATSPPQQDTSRGEERTVRRWKAWERGKSSRCVVDARCVGPRWLWLRKNRLRKVGTFLETYTPTGCAVCTTSARNRKGNDSY